jgi:hypothetical protein
MNLCYLYPYYYFSVHPLIHLLHLILCHRYNCHSFVSPCPVGRPTSSSIFYRNHFFHPRLRYGVSILKMVAVSSTDTSVFYYYLVCEAIGTAATPGLLCQPRVIMMMIMEKRMECRLAGETEVIGENLPQRHFCVHHKIPYDQTRV